MNQIATCNTCLCRFCPILEGIERQSLPFCSRNCADNYFFEETDDELSYRNSGLQQGLQDSD